MGERIVITTFSSISQRCPQLRAIPLTTPSVRIPSFAILATSPPGLSGSAVTLHSPVYPLEARAWTLPFTSGK